MRLPRPLHLYDARPIALVVVALSAFACAPEETDLAGYAPEQLTVGAGDVYLSTGPKRIAVDIMQGPGDCKSLSSDVTATIDGRTMTLQNDGGSKLSPSRDDIGNTECQWPTYELELEPSDFEALDANAVVTIEDASHRVVFEAVRPMSQRRLERSDDGPVHRGEAVAITWTPAAELAIEGSLLELVDVGASAFEPGLALPFTHEAGTVRFNVPEDAPSGDAMLRLSGLSSVVTRCEGVGRCTWFPYSPADGSQTPSATMSITIAP